MRIDSRLAHKARLIASAKGVNLVDYLSEILEPSIERDFRKLLLDAAETDDAPEDAAKAKKSQGPKG